MRLLNEKIKVELSVEEYLTLNELIERDTEKPMIDGGMPLCPNCKRVVKNDEFCFCPFCGQRLDHSNYAL